MDGPFGALGASPPVDLAIEPDLTLGRILVSPSLCELRIGSLSQTIEPRVMQVLVTLARAAGSVVSRDELVRLCWSGRIVGDDAINSCVAKVRRLAGLAGEPLAFKVETIPRVGYRLKLLDHAPTSVAAAPVELPRLRKPSKHRWPFPAAVMAALIVLFGGLIWSLRMSATHWTVVRSEVPIAEWPIQRHPAISPDGNLIAYSAGNDLDSRQIYLKHVAGGEPLRLTRDDYDDVSPAWSPDGSEIAYVSYKRGEPCRLMVTSVPAGASRQLGSCHTDERSHLAWSRSGAELFFLDRFDGKSPERIMRFDLATGKASPLTKPANTYADEGEPVVSPDGRWATFARCPDDVTCQRIILDLKTGGERVLYTDGDAGGAAWSPDSQTLFVDSDDDPDYATDFALWAWPMAGGPASRILSSPERIERLSSGPNGLLASELTRMDVALSLPPERPGDVPRFLEATRGEDYSPDMAPDGTLAFVSDRLGHGPALWLKPKDGPIRQLVHVDGPDGTQPRWSPDGSRIAFPSPVGGGIGFRVVSVTGAEVAKIPFAGKSLRPPAWTADGTALIFPGRDSQGWRLWRVDLVRPTRVEPMPQTGWVSIRGRGPALFGIREDQPGVWQIDGTPRRVTSVPSADNTRCWTIAGDAIAYLDEPTTGERRILAQPIDGGPAHVLAEVPNYLGSTAFAYDPASGGVIYSAIRNVTSDIELLHLSSR